MISYTLLSFSLLVSTLGVSTEAAWFRHGRSHIANDRNIGAEQQQEGWHAVALAPSIASTTASESYTFSVQNASIIAPTLTSQGMTVTSVVPVYEICNTPGANTTSCSTVYETLTTTTCSTVLTYAFSKLTITDCESEVTFSTENSYALATTTLSLSTTLVPPTGSLTSSSPSPTLTTATYVESIVSYYIAPWQSLAADTPQDITLLVCTFDYYGNESCTSVQEVWIVHTEYVLVSTTSTLLISTSLTSDAVLLLGPTQSVTAPAGSFTLSTQILYSSMVPNATTSISTLTSSDTTSIVTSTTTSITMITLTGAPTTITMTLNTAQPQPTTYLSTTVVTSTVTVQPQPQKARWNRKQEFIQRREQTLADTLLRT